jgi:hypothetical protein
MIQIRYQILKTKPRRHKPPIFCRNHIIAIIHFMIPTCVIITCQNSNSTSVCTKEYNPDSIVHNAFSHFFVTEAEKPVCFSLKIRICFWIIFVRYVPNWHIRVGIAIIVTNSSIPIARLMFDRNPRRIWRAKISMRITRFCFSGARRVYQGTSTTYAQRIQLLGRAERLGGGSKLGRPAMRAALSTQSPIFSYPLSSTQS